MSIPSWRTFLSVLILLAVSVGALLLLVDVLPQLSAHLAHAPLSAIPLICIGSANLLFQCFTRPSPQEFAQALLVSLAFTFWGIDQLLPPSSFATTLGDLVIVMYVVDLSVVLYQHLHQPRLA